MQAKRVLFICAALCYAGMASLAQAKDFHAGDITVLQPRIAASDASATAAFMVISNAGAKPDWLVGGKAGFAGKVQVHEIATVDGAKTMRPLADGLKIPAGGEAALQPGGYHVMFMQLAAPLKAGEKRKVTLSFRNAGALTLDLPVEAMGLGYGHDESHGMQHSHDESGTQGNAPKQPE